MEISEKQCEYVRNANKRWNFKVGATQSGKTYIDTLYVIPHRILDRRGKKGLNVITGVSKSTIERNVLQPMRELFGDRLISKIDNENKAELFGEMVYCLGAENKGQVSKFRGSRIKYLYCDEVVEFNQEVFELLKSRLSFEYSQCDGSANPDDPNHWFKKFIDECDKDELYLQEWTIYDNPFLPSKFVSALEKEYSGTVYYQRYILGRWQRGEGLIYTPFADNPESFMLDNVDKNNIWFINCGVDFGNNKSSHTFVATAFCYNFSKIVVIKTKRIIIQLTPDQLDLEFIEFCKAVFREYNKPCVYRCDSAETTLINGFKMAVIKNNLSGIVLVKNALKKPINERIAATIRLMGEGRFKIKRECIELIEAFENATWDSKNAGQRLDVTGQKNPVDMLDAFEYSFEEFNKDLLMASII